MKSILLTVSNKLPSWQVELLCLLDDIFQEIDKRYLIVGARARDIIMEHVYKLTCPRATLDTDLGVLVENWTQYYEVTTYLQQKYQFQNHSKMSHRLTSEKYGIIDLIPFGDIENEAKISWPPEYETHMSLMGFNDVYNSVSHIEICPEYKIPVASPAGLVTLKIIAWEERSHAMKDAEDFIFILMNYLQAGNQERLFNEFSHLLNDNFDYETAGAFILGHDVGQLTSNVCRYRITDILKREVNQTESSVLINLLSSTIHSIEEPLQKAKKIVHAVLDGINSASTIT